MDGELSFFSLNKAADWEQGQTENIAISEQGMTLKISTQYGMHRLIRPEETGLGRKLADFAVGPYGLLYLLDEDSGLWTYDYETRNRQMLFAPGHDLFSPYACLAARGEEFYLADWGGDSMLWAFASSNGQVLWRIDELGDPQENWVPLAIAAGNDGCIYVLLVSVPHFKKGLETEIPAGEKLGAAIIDSSGRVLEILRHTDFIISSSSSLAVLRDDMSISVGSDRRFYVLNGTSRQVFGFHRDYGLDSYFLLEKPLQPGGLCIDTNGFIYVSDGKGTGEQGEEERYIWKYSAQGKLLEPITRYHDAGGKILQDNRRRLYIWNRSDNSLQVMAIKEKMVGMGRTESLPRGMYISTALDSGVMELLWHRIKLEVEIPEDTQLRLYYLASDRREFVINGHYADLDDYIRNDNIPMEEKMQHLDPYWSEAFINPRDCLLHHAQGRYLWIAIEFNGSEQQSPRLQKLRVYYPRMSFLQYLPAVYQQDEESRDFLERFLSLFSSYILDMEEEINNISQLFDPQAVPASLLTWLGSWLAVAVDESWTDEQLRQLVLNAPRLYRKRGTRQGIEELVEIYTGEKPLMVEYFQYKYLQQDSELKDIMTRLYGQDPYCFHVLVKQEHVQGVGRYSGVQKILNEEKPAFTEARLVVLQPWIYMDMHTYLGINTYLSELSLLRLDRKSSMPYSSLLVDVDQQNRLDIHSRMEMDAELK